MSMQNLQKITTKISKSRPSVTVYSSKFLSKNRGSGSSSVRSGRVSGFSEGSVSSGKGPSFSDNSESGGNASSESGISDGMSGSSDGLSVSDGGSGSPVVVSSVTSVFGSGSEWFSESSRSMSCFSPPSGMRSSFFPFLLLVFSLSLFLCLFPSVVRDRRFPPFLPVPARLWNHPEQCPENFPCHSPKCPEKMTFQCPEYPPRLNWYLPVRIPGIRGYGMNRMRTDTSKSKNKQQNIIF